ncbi:hypothetical protein D6827_00530 [Candidatus Parcubacteria bacterium]|nr:MAG: hypothetical protein D6827_00530 [Candidatus Parcubacteria bacterium]
MKKPSFLTLLLIVGVFIVLILIAASYWRHNAPSEYDSLAQCITEKGGSASVAYWCGNCAAQEKMFGSAWRYIDERECSSPGSKTFDLCPDIKGTPTWHLPDGSRVEGVQSLENLAKLYGCQEYLPE